VQIEAGDLPLRYSPSPPEMAVSGGDGRPPGSSGEGRLNAPSQFGIKKDIPIPHIGHQVTRNISMVLFYGVKAIIIYYYLFFTQLPRGECSDEYPWWYHRQGSLRDGTIVTIGLEVPATKMNISLLKNERLKSIKSIGYANYIYNRLAWGKEHFRGFTLIELAVVIFILGTLAGIAMPVYTHQIEKARIVRAIAEITIMGREIAAYEGQEADNFLPKTLNDIGRGNLLDPWGHRYRYLNFALVKGKGPMRKDGFMVPLNTDYDLYSVGKDGATKPPLTAKASHDDVVRANDGAYVGLGSEY